MTYATPLIEGQVLYVIDGEARALELPARAAKGMRLKELWKTGLKRRIHGLSRLQRRPHLHDREQKCRLHVLDAKTAKSCRSPGSWIEATGPRRS